MASLLLMTAGMTSCSDDDDKYDNVTPPVVVVKHEITGSVLTAAGEPITGASVKMVNGSKTATATTDAQGAFTFADLSDAGTYTLTAEAKDRVTKTAEATIEASGKSQSKVVSIVMEKVPTVVTVKATEETKMTVTPEASKANVAAAVPVEVKVPAQTFPEGTKLSISVNLGSTGVVTKANVDMSLFSVSILSDKAMNAGSKFDIKLPALPAGAVVKVGGATTQLKDGVVEIQGTQIKPNVTLTVVAGLTMSSTSAVGSVAVSFAQAEFDNLYGSKPISVKNPTYTYFQGMEAPTAADVKKALSSYSEANCAMIASAMGQNTKKTVTGTSTMDMELPIGTKLNLTGVQKTTKTTWTVGGKSFTTTTYGDVAVTIAITNRQDHNGG